MRVTCVEHRTGECLTHIWGASRDSHCISRAELRTSSSRMEFRSVLNDEPFVCDFVLGYLIPI